MFLIFEINFLEIYTFGFLKSSNLKIFIIFLKFFQIIFITQLLHYNAINVTVKNQCLNVHLFNMKRTVTIQLSYVFRLVTFIFFCPSFFHIFTSFLSPGGHHYRFWFWFMKQNNSYQTNYQLFDILIFRVLGTLFRLTKSIKLLNKLKTAYLELCKGQENQFHSAKIWKK